MELVLDAGADDVIGIAHGYEVRYNIHAFDEVAHALEKAGLKTESAEIAYIPVSMVPVTDPHTAQTIVKLHDTLEAFDDVQAVFSNEEMDEKLSEAAYV